MIARNFARTRFFQIISMMKDFGSVMAMVATLCSNVMVERLSSSPNLEQPGIKRRRQNMILFGNV
jgi:hypothetical protein